MAMKIVYAFLNRTDVKLSLLISLCGCVYYSINNLSLQREASKNKGEDTNIVEYISPAVTQEHIFQLNQLYQAYAKKKPQDPSSGEDESKQQGLTHEEQLQQRGELTEVFLGDNKLQLKAVIFDRANKEQYAIVQIDDLLTNQTKMEQIRHNDLLLGAKVTILSNKSVLLSIPREQISQEINLTMFKTQNSVDSQK